MKELEILKKLICCVLPGVFETLAILLFTRALIRLDFPTLDLPTNANSGRSKYGIESSVAAPARNSTRLKSAIFINAILTNILF